MRRLRLVPYRKLRKIAEAYGFQLVHRAGSRCFFGNAEGRIVVIPDYGSKVMVRPPLRSIIRDLGTDVDETTDCWMSCEAHRTTRRVVTAFFDRRLDRQ